MNRYRLIESFTWMMLNIEWSILEELDELHTNLILNFNKFKEIGVYLRSITELDNEAKMSKDEYLDILDHLINMDKHEQQIFNEKLLKDYTERELIHLIRDEVDLLMYIDTIK